MATVRKFALWFISCFLLMFVYFKNYSTSELVDEKAKVMAIGSYVATTSAESIVSDTGRAFRDLIKPNISCDDNDTVVIFVLSTINATLQRDFIRATWGNVSLWNGMAGFPFTLCLFFVVGTPCHENDTSWADRQAALLDESRRHGDLLLSDTNDCYGNLTNKAISALALVNRTCQLDKISFVFKTDDDVFVNIPRLLLLMNASTATSRKQCHVLCNVMRNVTVARDGKWAVPIDLFPWEAFPVYCQGVGYALCRRGLEMLLSGPTVPTIRLDPFPLEDVFMTSLALRGSNWTTEEDLTYHAIKHSEIKQRFTGQRKGLEKYVMIHRLPGYMYKDIHENIVVRLRNGEESTA